MNIELYIAIMAGCVLSFFLMVSEIVFLRKRLVGIRSRLRSLCQSGRFIRLALSIFSILAFILVQPLIVGLLVAKALDKANPGFLDSVLRGIRHGLTGFFG